ncbi:Hypothetical protein NTJ_02869 [Nesidiocoris tenuis]|uniref:Uncharacterized protein n=1 Tax=Nesidiocoris tenuis TaxID=355587 RepID=A0ABN7AGR5_9HEMI|nr:Hypothetical protein NTJ_02869 [Nesidiocoris tenuis]
MRSADSEVCCICQSLSVPFPPAEGRGLTYQSRGPWLRGAFTSSNGHCDFPPPPPRLPATSPLNHVHVRADGPATCRKLLGLHPRSDTDCFRSHLHERVAVANFRPADNSLHLFTDIGSLSGGKQSSESARRKPADGRSSF